MNFYIASSFQNKQHVQTLATELKRHGLKHTYDWTKTEKAVTFDELASIGEAELEAVKKADILIVLLPGGKGTHVELGIALGRDLPVYLFNEEGFLGSEASSFYYTSGVTRVEGNQQKLVQIILEKHCFST
ncbi:nucleoside 2-deoxyribosyltransferase [Guptibacillus hwajinpoensis]|uniref:nucleoside 2-deoxyribosyltransferase n=1 Tax=Guptibacillus hwajinpoensis TaxID=208199 RepID=UPI001CD50ECC|nr:nucleoside 2-deoxyribosyltransferase [Pseudalkalibacillus hwajinpoensis]MCA0991284.1 nucleoside 2-deoxyribosyltransferase [Pseudalkalibacillus hwajinpoensis]